MHRIYLDNAATTPMDPEVIDLITESMHTVFGNPSSTHHFGRKARSLTETARKEIAEILNCSASELIFTSGGTEANNLILRNAVNNLGVRRIISSRIEHPAVLNTLKALQKEFNTEINYVHLLDNGDIDLHHLELLLKASDKKTLVSLMLVNNEIGNLLEISKVYELCKKNNALFHSDTVQGIGHIRIDLQKIPVDFITASAHKFHGPKGVGFAYFKKGTGILPILTGGEQERGARAGTENIHSILGMAKALKIAEQRFAADKAYITGLKSRLIKGLTEHFKEISFNGTSAQIEHSASHILNVRFPKEISMLLFSLDLKGIAASGGSACQSGSNKGSHVLQEILSQEDTTKTSVRFSFSKYNTKEEIDTVIGILKEIIKV